MPRRAPEVSADKLDSSVWKIAGVALFGALLAQLDATIVNVSLSSLAVDLHSSLATVQWVTSGYLLALVFVLPLNGWLVDRIGAKALYLWCFSAFTLCSALCALAGSAPALIALRVLQGLSGGLLAPMAQMMIARTAGRHLARVAGYMSLPVLLAPLLGPVAAGFILQHGSWRWLFLVNLPIGAIAILLVIFVLPADRDERSRRKLDWLGLALLSPGLALFLYGAGELGDAAGRTIFVAGITMMGAFLWSARRKRDRALIDLHLFRGRVFSIAAVTQFLSNGSLFAGQMLIPAFLIQACGREPAEMGGLMAPLGIGMMIANPFMGALTGRFGIRAICAGGALLSLFATSGFLYLATEGLSLSIFVPALLIRGIGMGCVGLPSLTAAYASVSRQRMPMATTSLNIVQRLGGPTMTTLCATCLAWRLEAQTPNQAAADAFEIAFAVLCVLHALTVLSALRLPRRLDEVTPVS